ncbi:MAG: PEGA domain-containing protein [Candidatus Zixiibacteriota bacterium]
MNATQSHRGRTVTAAVVASVVVFYVITDLRWGYGPLGHWVGSADAERSTAAPLYITSVPDSADVYINNDWVGTTPYPYETFDPGILRVRLEREGLVPVETVLIIREDAPPPVFPPFIFSMHVELLSVPEGGQPIVDGRPLRPYDAVNFNLPATETVAVAFELDGRRSTSAIKLNPVKGLVGGDTALWRWQKPGTTGTAALVGLFARRVIFRSEPSGAELFLDGQPMPVGRANGGVEIPYGSHVVRFVRAPFRDHRTEVVVTADAPDTFAVVLQRDVLFAAVDAADSLGARLPARIAWIRSSDGEEIDRAHHLPTPGLVELEGRSYTVKFDCKGYADTTVQLAWDAAELVVGMRSLRPEPGPEVVAAGSDMGWVRFVVSAGRNKPVAGAEVIGVEKHHGNVVRYGPTDAAGLLLVQVPVGDYRWQAEKEGFVGKTNGERVKVAKNPKKITLKLKPR